MNRILFILGVSVLVSGCAAKVVAGTERTVIISAHPSNAAGALNAAQAECVKFGRHARINETPFNSHRWVFDCIP